MSIVDPVQDMIDAMVLILNADTELRTLFGRTTGIVIPWESFNDARTPVLAYAMVLEVPQGVNTRRVDVQLTGEASSSSAANRAVKRAADVLTYPAFLARGIEVARNPEVPPTRTWSDAEPLVEDAATARADITLSFLITG